MYPAVEIEDGIPMPAQPIKRTALPWKLLQIGQSFFVPQPDALKLMRLQCNLITYGNRIQGKRFTTRRQDGGVRVWRVA